MELGKHSLTDGEAMFMFVEGLKPAVRHQVYVNRPATLADAELDAERIDSALYLSKGKGDTSGPVPMDLGVQFGDYQQGGQRGKGGGREGRDRGRGGGDQSEITCWQCGEKGHTKR